ncbi:hypothetical protein D9M69_653440 [compost metagenome]
MARAGAADRCHNEEVGPLGQAGERGLVAVLHVVALAAVVVADVHVEARAAARDGFADAAQAHDAQLLAADAQAQRDAAMHLALAPEAGAHEAFALAHAAGAGDQQAPG